MNKNNKFKIFCIITIGLFLVAGCTPTPAPGKPAAKSSSGSSASGHAHGPRGGELFSFADAGINGEWVAKYGDNMITFYFYGDDKKTERAVKANKLVASRKVTEVETFDIPAINLENDMASRFEIVDEAFAIAMKTTGATLEIELDGVKHTTQLEKDPHAK